MAVDYFVKIYSRAGIEQELLTGRLGDPSSVYNGYTNLSYIKEVNGVGNGAIVIHAESGAIDSLVPAGVTELDAQVEIWRADADNGIDAYCDFYGLLRDHEFFTDDQGTTFLIAYLNEQSDFLRREIVGYPADTADRSLFSAQPTETILKTLVTRNATSSGTTGDGRIYNVDSWGANISVEADGAGGTTQTKACFGRNLHEVLFEVARAGGLDFSLVKTGAQAWEFRTDTLLGDDRSNEVTFALQYGNMRLPRLRTNRRAEKTVVVVGGRGQESTRTFVRRTGSNYNASYNSFVTFLNDTRYTTTAGLNTAGDERLEELRARDSLIFDVIQVDNARYGLDYFLGDKVTAYYRGFTYTPQVRKVSIDVRNRGTSSPEQINVDMSDE